MATVSYIQEHHQSPAAMKAVINYCCQDMKVFDKLSGRRLVSGVNCDGENAYKEFMTTKRAFQKSKGVFFYQYTQSFSPKEDITPEQAHEIALEFAEKAWKGHEVMVATHCNREHIHSHFIINSVDFENGLKLRQSPNTLKELRKLSDEICKSHGYSVLEPYEKSGLKMSTREYRAATKGDSWKFKLMNDIETAMEYSGSKQDFIDNMSSLGYSMTWTPQRKYITFHCPNGMKCRDIRLHEDKFLKENIENELRIRKAKYGGSVEAEKQKISQRDRNVLGRNEDNYNSDSGQRGRTEPAQDGGELSARAVREDFYDTYPQGDGRIYERSSQHRRKLLSEDGGHLPERVDNSEESYILEYGTDGEEYPHNTVGDAGEYQTGWEESRELFEKHLAERQRAGEVYSRASEESGGVYSAEVDTDFSPVFNGLDSLVSSVSKIVDDGSEDEEERRRRIEAEENSSNLGAVLGTVIGLAGEALSSRKPKSEPEYEDFNDEYIEDEPEEIGFGFSM